MSTVLRPSPPVPHASPSARRRGPRPGLTAAAAALLAVLTVLAGAPAASAESASAYRYWGYYSAAADGWTFAQTGPDGAMPADGSIEGWRFAVAGESDVRQPRALPAFDEVCLGEALEGMKQVAVVLDYGRPADAADTVEPPAPRAACAVVDGAATGADVLASVAQEVRVEGGLVCGIDGYPATGCGDAVEAVPAEAAEPDGAVTLEMTGTAAAGEPSPDAAATPDTGAPAGADAAGGESATDAAADAGSTAAVLGGLVVVLVVAGALVLAARRRNRGVEGQ